MTQALPTPADLAALPPLPAPLPAGCSCPWPAATGCQVLRKNLARYWDVAEPEGERCDCPCHSGEKRCENT